ncbi:MAG: hypothetical protein R3B45_17875 [Bdellovibrionota bacterium]
MLGRVDVSFPTTSQTLESQRCQGFKYLSLATKNETSTRPSKMNERISSILKSNIRQ